MAHKSVLTPWLDAVADAADNQYKDIRPTLLQRWLLPSRPIEIGQCERSQTHKHAMALNTIQPKRALTIFPTPNCSDSDPEQQAYDLYSKIPEIVSDSSDSNISRDVAECTATSSAMFPNKRHRDQHYISANVTTETAPSDGYLWNLIPPYSKQYLDLNTVHSESSSSRSRDSSQSDDSIVCEDGAYTKSDIDQLQLLFPITTRRMRSPQQHCQQKR
jgi:hypothetical protein